MLALAASLSPLIAWQVHVALGSNSNDVRDWLPAEYPETAEYHAFFHRFGSEDFVAASWPGCQLDDPRLERFAERLHARPRAADQTGRHGQRAGSDAAGIADWFEHDSAVDRLQGRWSVPMERQPAQSSS